LEAAPVDVSAVVWATTAAACLNSGSSTTTNDCQSNSIYAGTFSEQSASRTSATLIGYGMRNTNRIYARLTTNGGAATGNYAAGIAWAYTNNSKTDWHLPSKDELNQMCKWQRNQSTAAADQAVVCDSTGALNTGTTATGFSATLYWSSSENSLTDAYRQNFSTGVQSSPGKSNSERVRAARAFG
jgi:GT2 family glycosyltransferase